MNDIAQRLRESAKATFYDPLKSELNEAASHIEKLEAAMREIIDLHYDHGPKTAEDIYVRDGMAHDIARKTLEEKDD